VAVKQNGKEVQRLKLRRIVFKTKEGKVYVFITNNFTLPPSQIATILFIPLIVSPLFRVLFSPLLSSCKRA
jgi:hypothetical protein